MGANERVLHALFYRAIKRGTLFFLLRFLEAMMKHDEINTHIGAFSDLGIHI